MGIMTKIKKKNQPSKPEWQQNTITQLAPPRRNFQLEAAAAREKAARERAARERAAREKARKRAAREKAARDARNAGNFGVEGIGYNIPSMKAQKKKKKKKKARGGGKKPKKKKKKKKVLCLETPA